MKKKLALSLACAMVMSLTACGGGGTETPTTAAPVATAATEASKEEAREAAADIIAAEAAGGNMDVLIETAEAKGELTVYGSCGEEYLLAACRNFESLYGIKAKYQRLSTSEVYTKIPEEAGKPSTDVWFGGAIDPYNEAVVDGLSMEYDAINARNLINDNYKDPANCWYGIYKGILGFVVNTEELDRLGLEAPKTRDDLTKEEYKDPIMLSNPNTIGTAKLLINIMVQMKGHDEVMEYFKKLDENISQYTKSGPGPSRMIGSGECVIGIGFLHGGIYQIFQRYDNIQLIVPEDGTSFEVGATAIFNGCTHPSAAKLWIEYVLSPDCMDHVKENGSYQFLVLSNMTQSEETTKSGLDTNNTIDYDFEDTRQNSAKYVEDFSEALGSSTDSADSSRPPIE